MSQHGAGAPSTNRHDPFEDLRVARARPVLKGIGVMGDPIGKWKLSAKGWTYERPLQ